MIETGTGPHGSPCHIWWRWGESYCFQLLDYHGFYWIVRTTLCPQIYPHFLFGVRFNSLFYRFPGTVTRAGCPPIPGVMVALRLPSTLNTSTDPSPRT